MQGVYLPCSFSCNCYAFSSFILLPAPQQRVNLRISIVIFLITLHNFLKYIYIYMLSITYSFIKNLCSQYSIILLSTRIYEVRERGSEAEVSVKRDQLCRVDRLPNPSADLQWSGTTSSVWTAPKSVTCHFWSLFVATERARNGCQKRICLQRQRRNTRFNCHSECEQRKVYRDLQMKSEAHNCLQCSVLFVL